MDKRTIFTAGLLCIVIVDLLVIIIALAGRLILDWPPLYAFYPFFYGAQLALLIAGLAILQTIYGVFKKNSAHIKAAVSALLLGLTPLLVSLASVGPSGFQAPMIHDITTDTEDPPEFSIISSLRTAEDNSLDYAGEEIASQQRQAFPQITPLDTQYTPGEAYSYAVKAATALGWQIIVGEETSGTIEASDESQVFGFIDDVVIRIRPLEGGSRLDLRSVSRVGLGDLGANAARIQRFFREFQVQASK